MLRLPIVLPSNRQFQGSQPTQLSLDKNLQRLFSPKVDHGHQTEVTDSALKAFPSNTWLEFHPLFPCCCSALLCARWRVLSSLPVKHRWSLLNSALGPLLGLRSVGNRRPIVPEGWNSASGLCCMCVYSFKGKRKTGKEVGSGKGPFVTSDLS